MALHSICKPLVALFCLPWFVWPILYVQKMVTTVDALRFVGVGLNLTVHAFQFWLMRDRHRVLTYSIVLFFVVSIGLSVSLGICFALDADGTSVSTAVYTLSLFLESVCTVHSNFVAVSYAR